jgi:phosphoesterase RecJ-like protein
MFNDCQIDKNFIYLSIMTNDSLAKIVETILKSKKILLIVHRHPDADALGALVTMRHWLDSRGRQLDIYCPDAAGVDNYKNVFFIGTDDFNLSFTQIKNNNYDCIIILDCGSASQAGIDEWVDEYKRLYPQTVLINIDHHFSNNFYGHLNYVATGASSTCELVFNLLRSQKQTINSSMATAMLFGIVFDTGSFSNGATTLESLKISAELLRLGARHYYVSQSFLCNKEISLLRLWGTALSRLKLVDNHNLAYTYISKEELAAFGLANSDGLSNFLSNLNDADIVMVVTEKEDQTLKVSLRTTKEGLDVMKIAVLFGGGGHVKAAGFSINGGLEKIDEIITTISHGLSYAFDRTTN